MTTKHKCYAQRAAAGILLLLPALALALLSSARSANAARSNAPVAANPIPVGTILPVELNRTLSVEDAAAGQEIEAHITQDVPLSNHEKIRLKSQVFGKVVSITRSPDGDGVEVSLRFDKVEYEKSTISVTTSLRAMASALAVSSAQHTRTGSDAGTPSGWGDTVQIGGDRRFGDGGEVRNRRKQKVGKGVSGGGVLVHVTAQPGSECEGPVNGDDRLQALWVFSADACGLYDLKGARILHTGKTDPVGLITLQFEKDKMKSEAVTGILLRTVAGQ